MTGPLELPYSDNEVLTVADRLRAEIAADPERLDVASGYFAPSVWAAAGDALAKVGRFRLLLGKDHELDALTPEREGAHIEALVRAAIDRDAQPPGLVTEQLALQLAGLIEFIERQHAANGGEVVKLWRGDGFLHAKAFILAGSAGIGSANFTFGGFERNRELVGWRQDRREVAEVREWFERYWEHDDTAPYTTELLDALRATPMVSEDYRPYDVLIRTLAARYGAEIEPSLEQARFRLRWFQEDAVFRLVKLLNSPARGALLADAVGLGKTYMALGVINHFLYNQAEPRRGKGRPVLLIVPASLRAMWEGVLEDGGLDWACRLITMQSLRDDLDPRLYSGADLVVIDEAHRLRGGRIWFQKTMDLLAAGDRPQEKRVLLLTATPVNTSMKDLTRLLRVLTKNERSVWAPDIADFERHLDRVENGKADPFPVLDRSLVRRSRSDIVRAEEDARAAGLTVEKVKLPKRSTVHIDYAYDSAGADLFDTFAKALRSLTLAPYDLERYRGPAAAPRPTLRSGTDDGDEAADDAPTFAPGSLAALLASGLLTRFQSSIPAIRKSLHRLDGVLRRFDEALSQDPPRVFDLADDPAVRRLLADESAGSDRDGSEPTDPKVGEGLSDDELDAAWAALLDRARPIEGAEELRIDELRAAVEHDRAVVAGLIERLPPDAEDGKINALIEALARDPEGRKGAPGLAGRRVLVFTQFRDTARYVHRRLKAVEERVGLAALIDGGVPPNDRAKITALFDPAGTQEQMAAAARGEETPRILVSTDVLAEGHNLQEASAAVNFDLHFNPQVAVQRAGRIDRLDSPHGRVYLVSMLPPESLDRHIGLLARLDDRFRRIHGLGLGDETVMPLAADVQGQTIEQMRRLYADDATVLDEIERSWTFGSTDFMRQPLSAFLTAAGREQLSAIPVGVSSVKRLPSDWKHGPGVFISFAAPAPTGQDRQTYWRFYPDPPDGAKRTVLQDDVAIFQAIACRQSEPRAELTPRPDGPGIFDWDLIAWAAGELARELTLQRSQGELAKGASERSRKIRTELRAGMSDLEIEGAGELAERLLQVRAEDYDARTGWSRFDEARRTLKRADTEGERRDAAVQAVMAGLELFGPPEADDADATATEVSAQEIQLVAYEALVEATAMDPERPLDGDQLEIVPDEAQLTAGDQ